MAMTKPAAYGLQVLSIPFLALGFPFGLFNLMAALSDSSVLDKPEFVVDCAFRILLLLVGIWFLFAGKRAVDRADKLKTARQ